MVKHMKTSLLETNPYLKDPVTRNSLLVRNIVTSSAVEGIQVTRCAASGRFVAAAKTSKAEVKPATSS